MNQRYLPVISKIVTPDFEFETEPWQLFTLCVLINTFAFTYVSTTTEQMSPLYSTVGELLTDFCCIVETISYTH